ncbi:hypothetical protein EMCG_06374 [[Emmonsia] crescens]|uniref:C2H2-type domain-containing protein n=1 Tax=[Emmonsia] crescens TaxID=73230 RepID=A0A0G2IBR9_9EURO|nr:hypothetical protein EMCG_06374 [Emmonsia crescens UAMH 3008]
MTVLILKEIKITQEMSAVKIESSESRQIKSFKNVTDQIYCSCSDCHNYISHFKTLSDKHMNKHDHSYRCTISDCDQQFAQISDMHCHVLKIHQVNSKEK